MDNITHAKRIDMNAKVNVTGVGQLPAKPNPKQAAQKPSGDNGTQRQTLRKAMVNSGMRGKLKMTEW